MQRSHSFTRLKSWFAPPDRLVQVARITSGVVMLAGCSILIGWKLNLAILTSVIPGAATMKANTAVCFLLAGISLSFQTGKRTRLATQIANGCAIVVSTIGLLTLSEYIFGWNLGIDELLVHDPVATIASDPGRMGINAAIDFSLVGIALWLANRQEPSQSQLQHRVKLDRVTISQSLALVAGFVAVQAIVSYTYNVRVFYQLSIFTTEMTLQTAIVFVVLCGGILALSSDRGWMRSFTSDLVGGDVARRFVPIAIPWVLGWLILRGHQANFYDTNFAFSLMSISLVAILLGLIQLNAGILNRVDYARIRSADRIRASEERIQLALEGANQGIWSLDIQTQVVTWDDRCKAIFGLSPDVPLTYAQRIDMLHPDDRQRMAEAMAIATREGSEFVQEYRTIYPNGTIRWLLSQGRGFCDPAGHPDRILGTMMDITARKQFLSRAIPIFDAAGQVIRWFGTNTDITERQTALRELEQAQVDLEQHSQELDAFGYVVAHDLKAPLRGIANLSQWIEDDLEGVLTADTQVQMRLLRSRVRRMEATIDGLLDYARVGFTDAKSLQGSGLSANEPVSVTELIADVIDSIDPPPTFTIVIDPNLPIFHTKRLRLSQVFTNLISNAIEHHDRADGSIHIFGRDLDDLYEFIVADDGPGIAPEQHDRVFEIFQSVNPQNRADSTGIGLAIVKKIIETEGGKIRLESEIGSGTKFYFTWPK